MLQSTEYHARDYLTWLHRVEDFRFVEKRKRLTWSIKTVTLFSVSALLWTCLIAVGAWLGFTSEHIIARPAGFALLLLSPILLAYGILAPLLVIRFVVQAPVEYILIRRAMGHIAKHPGVKIAIAGSYGKTTMREILRATLSTSKHVAAPPHSYNTPLGIAKFAKTLTGNEEVLIFELGEYYKGDIAKLCRIVRPDIGIITGVNEAHLQKFKTLDNTVNTIFELADALPNGPVYVNGESDIARTNAHDGHMVYSREGIAGWRVENAHSDLSGTSFTILRNNTRAPLTSGLLGLHQVGPLLTACHIAQELGASDDQIVAGVAATQPFAHRLAPRVDKHGVTTLDDSYNGNPDGVRAVINFFAALDGNRIYVTPGLVEMGTRSEDVHKDIGRQLADANIEHVVLIKNSVTPFIHQGLQETNYTGEITWFDDALTAYAALPNMTVAGDIILLQNDWPDQYA